MVRHRKKRRLRIRWGRIAALAGVSLLLLLAVSYGPGLLARLRSPGEAPDDPPPSSEDQAADALQAPDSYILPTDREYLTGEDLDRFTPEELVLIRNEIYARHGYDFQHEALRSYFDAKSWYQPVPGACGDGFDASCFNEYENANLALILACEEGRAPESAPSGTSKAPPAVVWTDRLAFREEVKSYAFQMVESGDAVIFASGLQEAWDGYPYHWACRVYGGDPETVLAGEYVPGYCADSGPVVLSLPDLEAGVYRMEMTAASSGNPFLTTFTEAPFQVRLIRHLHGTEPSYRTEGLQTFREAEELLWAFDGTGFLKLNDGECFGALMRSKGPDRAVVPVLFSTDPASVEYVVSSTGERIKAGGPLHSSELDADYYFSACQSVGRYTEKSVDTDALSILYIDVSSPLDAVEEILTRQADEKYREEHGSLKLWWKKHKSGLGTAGGVLLVIALLCLVGSSSGGGGGDREIEIDNTGSISEAISDWWADGV